MYPTTSSYGHTKIHIPTNNSGSNGNGGTSDGADAGADTSTATNSKKDKVDGKTIKGYSNLIDIMETFGKNDSQEDSGQDGSKGSSKA